MYTTRYATHRRHSVVRSILGAATSARSLVVVVAIGWTVLASVLIARDPVIGVGIGLLPIALVAILRYSLARLLLVVIGGMLVLGSSSDLSSSKVIYAGVVVACAAVSLWKLLRDPPAYARWFTPLIWWGLGFLGVIIISYFASPAGSDLGLFGRQATLYVLVILGPVIGLDAGRDVTPEFANVLIAILGTVAAVGFAFDWLDRRGVTALSGGRFVLASLLLPALAFALAVVSVFHTRGFCRILWLAPTLLIPVAMLITGTRTNLVIFIVLLFVLGKRRSFRVPATQMVPAVLIIGTLGIALFSWVASFAISDRGFLQARITAAVLVLTGSGAADQSFAGRAEQYQTAWALVSESPLFGYGLGYAIPFIIDSPLLTLVRLGWLGSTVLLAFLLALCISVKKLQQRFGGSVATTAFWGFVAVVIANLPFGTPFEDRGFGYAILLGTLAISAATNSNIRRNSLESI